MVNGRTVAEDMEREYQRQSLRDTFAAAALTGLLAQGDDGSFSEESYVRAAYRWADAMLRERAASAEKQSDVRDSRTANTLASGWINYNANDYVRVRLTDHARALLKKQHEALNAMTTYLPYTPPTEDADGWSKWQLHRLLNHFGAHTGMGMPLCFETTIQFDGSRVDHDAAPAARANAESVAPQPTAGDRSGNPTSHSGTGKQPAPPCVETDGFSPGSRTGQINRTPERESPRRECGEGSLRDVPQQGNCRAAGGPEHHISEAEIDALECVVEDGRIVGMNAYGHLRSLLVRLRPEWESDRSKPINDDRLVALEELSALDQDLELKHGIKGNPMIKARHNNESI